MNINSIYYTGKDEKTDEYMKLRVRYYVRNLLEESRENDKEEDKFLTISLFPYYINETLPFHDFEDLVLNQVILNLN